MKLIDKDALVAEIESKRNDYINSFMTEQVHVLNDVLDFLDTLEVKEVDLEKEINEYICNNFFGSQTLGFFANRTKEEPNDQDIVLCAKHFFKLGIQVSNKAQKGEKI